MNTIDGKETEESASRLEEGPKVRSVRLKDLGIEVGLTHAFILIMFAIFAKGYQGKGSLQGNW